jgi:hypothetical protein
MLLMIDENAKRKRRSRPRVAGAFIGAKRRAFTDAEAEGIRTSSAPLLSSLVPPDA